MLTTLADLILYPHIVGFNYGTRSKFGVNNRRNSDPSEYNRDPKVIRERSINLSTLVMVII